MPRLGVNIDHIATLRQVRHASYPDPFDSLPILVETKVAQVTLHLREDRRHIQDRDLERIIASQLLPVNMEMASTPEMFQIAQHLKPHTCTLVPEKREELTTEGGLNVESNKKILQEHIPALHSKGIRVSLFIDPDLNQIEQALDCGAQGVEFHTGTYCEVFGTQSQKEEFKRLEKACEYASKKNLKVFAGHGINLLNLPPLLTIGEIEEYNIGHSIVARAVLVGLKQAILEMQSLLLKSYQ